MSRNTDMPFLCNCTRRVDGNEPVVRFMAVNPETHEVVIDVDWCLKCDSPRGALPRDVLEHLAAEGLLPEEE